MSIKVKHNKSDRQTAMDKYWAGYRVVSLITWKLIIPGITILFEKSWKKDNYNLNKSTYLKWTGDF